MLTVHASICWRIYVVVFHFSEYLPKKNTPMKKKTAKYLEIRKNNAYKDTTNIEVTFDKKEVYKRFSEKGIAQMWKTLTNSKSKLRDDNNRNWYDNLDVSGYYRYSITDGEIKLLIHLDKPVNETEWISRLNDICPVKSSQVGVMNNPPIIEMDISLFGEYRMNKRAWI